MIGHINLGMKHIGKRSVGNPHAAFEEAGAGNVVRSRYCDTRKRKGELTVKSGGNEMCQSYNSF